jgi:Phage terminase large subunit (GpA)
VSDLQSELAVRLRDKLGRASVTTASRWAERYRVIDDLPWTYDEFPWQREMSDSTHEMNVGQKGAQLGYTEHVINVMCYQMDIHKRSVLYILPSQKRDATDFVNRALNPAMDMSPHIKQMFAGGVDNVGLKQVGNASLYIRGTNSKAGLKAVPAAVLIFDEYDEMDQENIKLAEERSSGQSFRLNWKISTPTVPGKGINTLFEQSTKEHFFFPCPACSRQIRFKFPDSLKIIGDDPTSFDIHNSHLICYECKATLPHADKRQYLKKGKWVAEKPGQITRGFNINQMYSARLPPYKLAISYLEALRDPTADQEFFNSKLGLPKIIEGAEITEEMVGGLIKSYEMVESCRPGTVITMGVDVNKTFNVEIDQWDLAECSPIDVNQKARCRVLWAGECNTIEEVGQFMTAYNVNFCVVDAMPETQLVTQFANNFFGRVRICRYNHYATARSVFAAKGDIQVSVNRTAWLDQSLGRFRNGTIYLPRNISADYSRHIRAMIRTPSLDTHGNLVYKYVHQDSKPDHYAHARNYAEIALPFASGNMVYKTIKDKVL